MNRKKYPIIIALLLVVAVGLSALCVSLYGKLQKVRLEAAQDNYEEWYYLFRMVEDIDEGFVQNENGRAADMIAYENSVVYHVSDTISPAFGTGSETFRFLCLWYDPLFRDLALDKVDPSLREEGFQLFTDMNTDLKEICSNVVTTCANNDTMKTELITEDSAFYLRVKEQLDTFCQKYYKLCNDFFMKCNTPESTNE